MFYLIYISTAIEGLSEQDIENILERSRDLNEKNDITGILIYHENSFIQMLEGEEEAVIETYGRIVEDERHFRVTKMFSGPSDKRYFPDWKMAYESVDESLAEKIKAYEPLETGLAFVEDRLEEHFALEMIHYFCELKITSKD